jgi:hypothetical protein
VFPSRYPAIAETSHPVGEQPWSTDIAMNAMQRLLP